MEDKSLKIYCADCDTQQNVDAWLNKYWSSEVKKISLWEPEFAADGTYGIFVDGATDDLRDDLIEVFADKVETEWEE